MPPPGRHASEMPLLLAAARRHLRERLAIAGVASPDAEAARLLEALTDLTPSGQLLAGERSLTRDERATLERWTRRREAREPLQHILGSTGFYGLELLATPEALVPRPETEVLVQLALEAVEGARSPRILDVGTGGGAIALALKHERPDAVVWGTDLASSALALARRNAERLALDVRFLRSDLLGDPAVAAFARSVELLVANPPYLPAGDRASAAPELGYDPPEALYAGERGLDQFVRLEREARSSLRPGAIMIVELDPRNVDEAYRSAAGWRVRAVAEDLAGRRRFLRLRR